MIKYIYGNLETLNPRMIFEECDCQIVIIANKSIMLRKYRYER
jgi:hypothetical protein